MSKQMASPPLLCNTHPDIAALLTESDVAALLRVDRRTVQAWRQRGTGPRFVRISNRAVRYRPSDIAEFTERKLVESSSTASARMREDHS